MLLIVILTSIILFGQYVYFSTNQLPENLLRHPATQHFCQLTGCEIPKQTDVALIHTRQLVIGSHPRKEKVLLANIVLVNQADFAQPYPTLVLMFRDINDQPITQQRFTPHDYLKGEMAGAVFMPPLQPVRLELELPDPGEHAVNYYLFILEF